MADGTDYSLPGDNPGAITNFLSYFNPAFGNATREQMSLNDQERYRRMLAGDNIPAADFNKPLEAFAAQEAVRKSNLEKQQSGYQEVAKPGLQRLSDFALTGKPLEEMGLQRLNAPEMNTMETAGTMPAQGLQPFNQAEMANPIIQKSITDFQKTKQFEKSMTGILGGDNTTVPQLISNVGPTHGVPLVEKLSGMAQQPELKDFVTKANELASTAKDATEFDKGIANLSLTSKVKDAKTLLPAITQASTLFEHRQKAETSNNTEEQLTRVAKYDSDPVKRTQAQGILDAMQERKKAIAKDSRSITHNDMVPRQTYAGVNDKGQAVFYDMHGKAPYIYGDDGSPVRYTGSIMEKSAAAPLTAATNTPEGKKVADTIRSWKLSTNPDFQKRGIVLESLPASLENTLKAGEALKMPSWKWLAKAKAGGMDIVGDPRLTTFQTNANDSVQNLAAVFRIVGMSEAAVELEKQPIANFKSGPQFRAWYKAQLEQGIPRVRTYIKKTGEGQEALHLMETAKEKLDGKKTSTDGKKSLSSY